MILDTVNRNRIKKIKCVLSAQSRNEHYIHDGGSQADFPRIKDKFIRAAIPVDRKFYLACSKDYDRDIDVLHSKPQETGTLRPTDGNSSILRLI